MITSSALDRLLACPASALDTDAPYNPTTPEANAGQAKHEALAKLAAGENPEVDEIAHRYSVEPGDVRLAVLAGKRLLAEVATWLPIGQRTNYLEHPLRGDDFTGRPDCVIIVRDDEQKILACVVIDWKTGFSDEEHPGQLTAYAALARDGWGMPACGYITTVEAQIRRGERVVRNHDASELDEFVAKVRWALDSKNSPPTPGSHCRFCVRRLECDAQANYLRAATAGLVERQASGVITREQLGALYDSYRDVMRAARWYEDVLTQELEAGPIPLPGGKTLRLTEEQREAVDVDAIPVLLEAGFTLGDLRDAVRISKSGIDRAAKAKAPPRQGAAESRRIMQLIRDSGAVVQQTIRTKEVVDSIQANVIDGGQLKPADCGQGTNNDSENSTDDSVSIAISKHGGRRNKKAAGA